jgi:hypothetical protein
MGKTRVIVVVAAMITGLLFAHPALAGWVGNRQIRQQKRIHQGVASGQVTWGEAWALEREQIRIQRHKRRAWHDGWLSPGERRRLEREQNRANRHIFRLKHNGIGW